MTALPQDLSDYLMTMISPPGEAATFWDGLPDLSAYGDATLCGLILRPKDKSEPSEAQSKDLLRILKPGAHLLIIAPDDQPTGHTAACEVEDAGFEIRDAICWANDAGDGDRMHYVAKAARAEREAGCQDLPAKTGAEATDREEDTAGLNNPRAGAGRTANEVHNFHPCVKPIAVMERLLADVPKDQGPVLDPFLGSGTTAIACIRTGHDFVGIEREAEYIAICDARAHHWKDKTYRGDRWLDCDIESDYAPPEILPTTLSELVNSKPKSAIEDLFG